MVVRNQLCLLSLLNINRYQQLGKMMAIVAGSRAVLQLQKQKTLLDNTALPAWSRAAL